MKIGEIYKILDEISPFASQEEWDNSGLLVGSFEASAQRVYLSLDIDDELLNEAQPNSLIITHHPLIFKGLKSLNLDKYPSSLIAKMMVKNLSLIAMHTNYDLSHLNEYVLSEILGFMPKERDGFVLYADVNLSFDELCERVKTKLNLSHLRVCKGRKFDRNTQVKRLAFCTGSGGDLIGEVKADVFLTGDLKYHQALEASHNNLKLIDIGHYESERYFGESLAKYLQILPIPTIISNSKNPFSYS
ncbi:Nif3-like dinuclear metal center hexameric protein [Campylobacter showae]|uniref:Nif3-like dinuclear metal center hexameric protein n=1 Tax=Campylobacter showae TaxID=204 RepID=UPI0028D6DA00|nr:Nif3-like dinuclear metal center hexameric protein [Campylobacter showae]